MKPFDFVIRTIFFLWGIGPNKRTKLDWLGKLFLDLIKMCQVLNRNPTNSFIICYSYRSLENNKKWIFGKYRISNTWNFHCFETGKTVRNVSKIRRMWNGCAKKTGLTFNLSMLVICLLHLQLLNDASSGRNTRENIIHSKYETFHFISWQERFFL